MMIKQLTIKVLTEAAEGVYSARLWIDSALDYGWEVLLDLADKIDRQ